MTEFDVDRYLARIGITDRPPADVASLDLLQQAHLRTVPFENVDVFNGVPVTTAVTSSYSKIVERGRGGWCFELNGAFGALLIELGFDVAYLGAAVLFNGPTVVIDHVTLEVNVDRPYLVDVGFGDSFITPLDINRAGPQDGGSGVFELIPSPQGTTLTRHDEAGVPVPQYRYKRLAREMPEFEETSQRLQDDKTTHWHEKAVATRLLDQGADRISLTGTTLTRTIEGVRSETDVGESATGDVLVKEFGIRP